EAGTSIPESLEIRQPLPPRRSPTPRARSWHALAVRVPDAGDPEGERRKLRRLEAWLLRHHRRMAIFRPDGRPRSRTVCFAVPVEEADRALAFRAFCRELGLGETLVQWRIGSCHGLPDARRPAR
ncbi:MAG: hypothetical protein VYD64_09745, partial [Pseudomonadota bacterium]|nr:hypothetical protein [Pseudomonadota bacterium]